MHSPVFFDLPDALYAHLGTRINSDGDTVLDVQTSPPCPTLVEELTRVVSQFRHLFSPGSRHKFVITHNMDLLAERTDLPKNFYTAVQDAMAKAMGKLLAAMCWMQQYDIPGFVEAFMEEVRDLEIPFRPGMIDVRVLETKPLFVGGRTGLLTNWSSKIDDDELMLILTGMPDRPDFPFASWVNESLQTRARLLVDARLDGSQVNQVAMA